MKNIYETRKNPIELKYAHLAPDVWEALAKLPRTGWVRRGIENPETVQQHILALMELAANIPNEDLSPDEREELIEMLEVHDWPEAINGDPVILEDDEEGRRLKAEKAVSEHQAMVHICGKLGDVGERILGLWMRFEEGSDKISSFAKQLDKYQAVEKAFEYEKKTGKAITQDFIDYASKFISHPAVLEKLDKIQESLKNI